MPKCGEMLEGSGLLRHRVSLPCQYVDMSMRTRRRTSLVSNVVASCGGLMIWLAALSLVVLLMLSRSCHPTYRHTVWSKCQTANETGER